MFRYWGKDDAIAQIKAQPFYTIKSTNGLTANLRDQVGIKELKKLQHSFGQVDRKEW